MKTTDEIMKMIDIASTPGADAFYGGNIWEEIRSAIDELQTMIQGLSQNCAEHELAIRELCIPILGKEFIEGDSWAVPDIVTLVELLVEKINGK